MPAKWKLPYVKDGVKTAKEYFDSKDPNEKVIRSVLSDKLSGTEIEICFFTLCGLRCAFCYQDHDDPTGIDSIQDKALQVIDYLKTANNLKGTISFQMLGGELFEDSIPDNYYEYYFNFVNTIHSWCADNLSPELDWVFTWISNLGFEKDQTEENMKLLFDRLDEIGIPFQISTSWDPTGRPMKFELTSTFHKNLIKFKDRVNIITFILTKQTCDFLLRNEQPYMEFLYENFTLQFDYFTPNGNTRRMIPDDIKLWNTLTMLAARYPKLPQITAWRENEVNPISCASLSRVSILPDGSMTACKHLQYRPEDFNTPLDFHSNASIIEKYITKKECLGCEYFNRCTLGCFLADDHKAFGKYLNECYMKKVFRFIDQRYGEQNAI